MSDTHSFKTLALPDSDPPFVVSPLKIAGITQKSAVVHWRTDEPTDGVILYGTSPSNLHWSKADARLKRKHNVQLTRLAKNTRYYLKAVSRDSAGNTIETPVESFITRNLPGCGKPRFVKRPTVVGKSDTIVTIEWEMDQPTDAVVEFGEDNHLYRQSAHGEKKTRHSVTLGGLEPGRSHNYLVRCTGTCGNTSRSLEMLPKHDCTQELRYRIAGTQSGERAMAKPSSPNESCNRSADNVSKVVGHGFFNVRCGERRRY